jgi:hypothetical protein
MASGGGLFAPTGSSCAIPGAVDRGNRPQI